MGVHCYLTELGTLVTMAAKIVAVISTLASLAAAEPGYGGGALHPYGGSSSVYRTTQGLTGYGYGGYGYGGYYGKRSADAEPGYMPLDILTEPHKVLQAMVVMDMEVMAMVVTMARDLLSQDTMAVPALMSTRAVLTTMDLMAMVSTTMARDLLMLDIMAMVWLAATSRLTGHTLPMVSVLLTLTK